MILVLGPEPALKWREFCEQIVAVAQRFEAAMGLTIGALLADVPHTRPTQIIGSATDEALIDRFELEPLALRRPDRHHRRAARRAEPQRAGHGVAVGGGARLRLAAAVAAGGDGARRAGVLDDGHAGAASCGWRREVADYDAKVAALIAEDDDLVTYVGRLEEMVDEMSDEDDDDVDDDDDDDDSTPSTTAIPKQLADEVERFLRDHGRES